MARLGSAAYSAPVPPAAPNPAEPLVPAFPPPTHSTLHDTIVPSGAVHDTLPGVVNVVTCVVCSDDWTFDVWISVSGTPPPGDAAPVPSPCDTSCSGAAPSPAWSVADVTLLLSA